MELMIFALFSFLAFIFHVSSKQKQTEKSKPSKKEFGLPEIVRTLDIMLENGIITQKEYNLYLIRVNDFIK